jgi:GNAT superfamily N-acetyltransferase
VADFYPLGRLAIDKEYRKHKFGGLLVEKLYRWIQEDAKTTNRPAEVECHSQIPAMGFYAR